MSGVARLAYRLTKQPMPAASATQAVLASWSFPPWITALNLFAALIYLRGWLVLHTRLPGQFTVARLCTFLSGLATLQIALASPIDAFDPFLLANHMIQHMLLMMIVPPLVLLGDPVIPMLHGLPRWAVRYIFGPILRAKPAVLLGRGVTHPLAALALVSLATIGWHLSGPYELALHSTAWHEAEHASFLIAALVFWWPVIQPWPSRARWNSWLLVIYLLLADFVNSVVSAFLVFSDRIYYPSYTLMPRLTGITPQNDQAAAGMIMWVIGGFAYLIPAAAITIRLLSPLPPRAERAASPPGERSGSRWLLALAFLLPAAAIFYGALAPETIDIDEDIVRTQADAGPFHISVFTSREADAGKKMDVAVLVQDEKSGSVIVNSDVEVAVGAKAAADSALEFVPAGHERAQNKILSAATLELPQSGETALRVSVRRGANKVMLVCDLPVGE